MHKEAIALPQGTLLNGGRYLVLHELNRGGTAVVYAAKDLQTDLRVALKVMNGPDRVPLKVVKREIDFSSTVHHDNIVKLLDVFAEKQQLVIVWEIISGPDLLDLLNEWKGCLPEDLAAFVFVQLLRAVLFMHTNGFCHRDIKPENCMAMGVLMFLLLTGTYPFEDPAYPNNLSRTIGNVLAGRMRPFPAHVSPQSRELICSLLKVNVKERKTLLELGNVEWLMAKARAYSISVTGSDSLVNLNLAPPPGTYPPGPTSWPHLLAPPPRCTASMYVSPWGPPERAGSVPTPLPAPSTPINTSQSAPIESLDMSPQGSFAPMETDSPKDSPKDGKGKTGLRKFVGKIFSSKKLI
eukprot:gene14801-20856_t